MTFGAVVATGTLTRGWLREAANTGVIMKSLVVKRSVVIAGHKTSVSVEDAFWTALKQIASSRELRVSEMIATIDAERVHGNLSSAIRLFVLEQYRVMSDALDVRVADTNRSQESSHGPSARGPFAALV